ncbi:MAG: ATP-binding cassette domain-containing protein [Roseiflexaceae bacterium]
MLLERDLDSNPILEVADLTKHFAVRRGLVDALRRAPRRAVRAIDGVSFVLRRGEVLALIGESGCGKTTTAMSVLGLVEPQLELKQGHEVACIRV